MSSIHSPLPRPPLAHHSPALLQCSGPLGTGALWFLAMLSGSPWDLQFQRRICIHCHSEGTCFLGLMHEAEVIGTVIQEDATSAGQGG